jgi:BirA family biotin operon repressor/biotin-[acetyl-CoA-carboxylase] ligase
VDSLISRREGFATVSSTNDVVRGWLAGGTPEVCVAVADGQTAGRGRDGRRWTAPPGTGLLVSLGFRPTWLSPQEVWQIGAVASLAMADAAEVEAGLPGGTIQLKWPNDLVIVGPEGSGFRKLGGVLGETEGLGTADPRLVIGVGLNVDWAAVDFPAELAPTMTSLRETAGAVGGGADKLARGALLERFLDRLEARVRALRAGRFDGLGWTVRQATTGRYIRLETPGGTQQVRATGVDVVTGALIVADVDAEGGERRVHVGEVVHVRPVTTTSAV